MNYLHRFTALVTGCLFVGAALAQGTAPTPPSARPSPVKGTPSRNDRKIESLLSKAETGDSAAQVSLAQAYLLRMRSSDDVVVKAESGRLAAEWMRKAADQGRADAQDLLGCMHLLGAGVSKDESEAVRWWQKASSAGDAAAQMRLGVMLIEGRGIEKDPKEALRLFESASETPLYYCVAQHNLGVLADRGLGAPKDAEKAFKHYQAAIPPRHHAGRRSEPPAEVLQPDFPEYNVAIACATGDGVTRSFHTAFDDLFAIEKRYGSSRRGRIPFDLGVLCADQVGGLKDAVKHWKRAASDGFQRANWNLGVVYALGLSDELSFEEAEGFLSAAGTAGDVRAKVLLGRLYVQRSVGESKAEGSLERGLELLRSTAISGNAHAQFYWAELHARGEGVPKNDGLAVEWWRKAAEQGLVRAQVTLGEVLRDTRGRGVQESDSEAAAWFRRAAEQGSTTAQLALARMYRIGEGVEVNLVDSYAWANLAASGGDTDAATLREQIAVGMSSEQIADAQKQSGELRSSGLTPKMTQTSIEELDLVLQKDHSLWGLPSSESLWMRRP